jgi:hypothetical protein
MLMYYDRHFEVTEAQWRMLMCAFARHSWSSTTYYDRNTVITQEGAGFSKRVTLNGATTTFQRSLTDPNVFSVVVAMGCWKRRPRDRADLLRCVLGNLKNRVYRELSWLTRDALALAKECRNLNGANRADWLVFADAVEDAGAPSALSDHLRECQSHSPYCHVARMFTPL